MQYMPKHIQVEKMPLIFLYFLTLRALQIFVSDCKNYLNVRELRSAQFLRPSIKNLTCAEWTTDSGFDPK